MTVAELHFFEYVPSTLKQIASELKETNRLLRKIVEKSSIFLSENDKNESY